MRPTNLRASWARVLARKTAAGNSRPAGIPRHPPPPGYKAPLSGGACHSPGPRRHCCYSWLLSRDEAACSRLPFPFGWGKGWGFRDVIGVVLIVKIEWAGMDACHDFSEETEVIDRELWIELGMLINICALAGFFFFFFQSTNAMLRWIEIAWKTTARFTLYGALCKREQNWLKQVKSLLLKRFKINYSPDGCLIVSMQ